MPAIRRATVDDADAIGRLLPNFNVEYEDVTPGADAIATRVRELLPVGEMVVLLAGDGPDGIAVLRFRPSLWTAGLECYLAELYVVPELRGRGIGRATMEAVLATARTEGADYIELNTGETDVAARALYESLGFDNHEGKPGGPVCLYYERDL